QLSSFNPQALSNIVWAYATAEASNPILFDKVACEVMEHRQLSSFNPQALSNIVWAYAKARVFDSCLFEKIADEAASRRHLGMFEPQHLSNIVWAFASVCLVDSPVFNAVVPRVKVLLHQCNNQDLTNIAWSCAVANVDAHTLFDGHFTNVLLEKMNRFNVAECSQLYQWHLWQKEEKGNIGLPQVFQERCYEAFFPDETQVSVLQRGVVAVLHSMGLKPKEEQLTQRGFSLDATVEVNGRKVGVEVDGPSHFIGRKPTGSTALKRRQIANVEGIMLVSVPYWKWDELGQDRRKKQNYLRSLLGVR
ncbi:hypothetical protein ACHAXR_003391, partial [Thalassiosira sp. AJA248-18]